MFGERAADLYETGKIFIKKNTQSECITVLKQWEARKLGPRLSQNSVFTPQWHLDTLFQKGPQAQNRVFRQSGFRIRPLVSEPLERASRVSK